MPTIPEAEAPGLIDESGLRTNMFVDLHIRRGSRIGHECYVFSVFRTNAYGLDRVYQLCVNLASKRVKDAHRRPHEHFGVLRRTGGAVVMHMFGSGIDLRDESLMRSITSIAELEGVSLNAEGEFEIWAAGEEVASAFAHYMASMDALIKWEADEVRRMSGPAPQYVGE